MPLYEYQCQECGETHEVVRRFSDPPYTACSSCGGPLKKLISAPAIQFKGSGFYLTDYGKGNSSKANESGAKSEGKGEGSKSGSEGSAKSEGTSSKSEGTSSKSEGTASKSEGTSKSEGASSRREGTSAGTKA